MHSRLPGPVRPRAPYPERFNTRLYRFLNIPPRPIGPSREHGMKRIAITALVACFTVTACMTYDPYTGEKKVSDTTKGAGIGAATGAVIGLLTGGHAAAHRKT